MKKIKILAPLFSIATVAATTIPMVACNSLGKIIEMRKVVDETDMCGFISDKLSLTKDTLYTIVVDLSEVKKITKVSKWLLGAVYDGERITPEVKNVKINNLTLKETTLESYNEGGWVFFGGCLALVAKEGTSFETKGKVQISFVIKRDIDKIQFEFYSEGI